MPEISLVVSQNVIEHVKTTDRNEKQIALRSATPDIRDALGQAKKDNRVNLRLGGCVTFSVGDPAAIHHSHNQSHIEDFDSLYDLLARRPDVEMRFLCEIV
jgi:hypothetical protein